ncbi:hypothetical protein [Lichenifustis flavocetrariae]|uniref:Uncharacterized protein n=1 Tax=Lichenifustis flavocetrariae TaxID=2949735 RepID=A0AA42CM02_9HYPH|nr:hypothetical protein [Lichenifustis flavocetrariae]MCW6512048.1 hypothetical protein [Lichenifustis flavocetrariae]
MTDTNRRLSPGAQRVREQRLALLDAHRWPQFGGTALDRKPPPVFAAGRDEQPHGSAFLGIMRCTGTDRIGARLHHPVRVISEMIAAHPVAHLRAINAVRYGETYLEDTGGFGRATSGWDDWTLEPIPSDTPLAPYSPVTIAADVLTVALPPGLTVRQFHAGVTRAIKGTALHHYVRTRSGEDCCTLSVTSPERLCRATNDPLAGGGPVEDLHLVDPQHDLRRLIRVVENVVATAAKASPSGSNAG